MIDPNEYESATESEGCASHQVPGEPAHAIALEQNVCDTCGQVRLFLVVEDEDGRRIVGSFDENAAARWGMLLLHEARDMVELNRAMGPGMSMN